MISASNRINTYAYSVWDDCEDTIRCTVFDNLTDTDIIALPSDIHMDAYRRTAQGGLMLESGDQTASVEILKRIDELSAGPIDIVCSVDSTIIDELPEIYNPYCNTKFEFDYVPPRVVEPRLPSNSVQARSVTAAEFGHVSGLAKCLVSAIEAVQLQLKYGGDALVLATYYATLWGLDVDYFMRSSLCLDNEMSEADTIASVDQKDYLTYIDPAWQAIVTTNRPAIESASFGSRAMIHWERVFYLARLQYIKGVMASGTDPRKTKYAPLHFRVDANIVHHHIPDCHALNLPPEIPVSVKIPSSLQREIMKTVVPLVASTLSRILEPALGGLLKGKVGSLTLVTPTSNIVRNIDPTEHEIRTAKGKISEHFSHDRYHVTQGISIGATAVRIIQQGTELHEVQVMMLGSLDFLRRYILTIPGVKNAIVAAPDAMHKIALGIGTHFANNYADGRVLGFLATLEKDTIRNRGPAIELAYSSLFGTTWRLSPRLGKYARVVQYLAYNILTLVHNDFAGCATAIRKANKDVKLQLHNGVMLGTPHSVAVTSRHLTYAQVHDELLTSMRRVYGRLLEHSISICDIVSEVLEKVSPGMKWTRSVQKAKRGFLGAIRIQAAQNNMITNVTVARDEERRTILALALENRFLRGDTGGTIDEVWKKVNTACVVQKWCTDHSVVKQRHTSSLAQWLLKIVRKHQEDHDALDVAINTLTSIAHVVHQHPMNVPLGGAFAAMFSNLQIGAPELDAKSRMYAELINRNPVEEYEEYLDLLDYDTYDEDQWKAVLAALDEHGIGAAIRLLKGNPEQGDMR